MDNGNVSVHVCVWGLWAVGLYHSFPRREGLGLLVSVTCFGRELSLATHMANA